MLYQMLQRIYEFNGIESQDNSPISDYFDHNNIIEERIMRSSELILLVKNEYDINNNLLEEKRTNNDSVEYLLLYYEYDTNNKLIKTGEKTGEKTDSYVRWWTYEYKKMVLY